MLVSIWSMHPVSSLSDAVCISYAASIASKVAPITVPEHLTDIYPQHQPTKTVLTAATAQSRHAFPAKLQSWVSVNPSKVSSSYSSPWNFNISLPRMHAAWIQDRIHDIQYIYIYEIYEYAATHSSQSPHTELELSNAPITKRFRAKLYSTD